MKDKKILILIAVVVLMIIGLVYSKSTAKKPVNWIPTFYNIDTNPYGTYINYELLKDVFPDSKIQSTRRPIYNNLKSTLETYFRYQNNDDENDDSYDYNDDDYDSDYVYEDDTDDKHETIVVDNGETFIPPVISADTSSEIMDIYTETDISDTTAYIFVNTEFKLDKVDLEYLLDFAGLGNNIFIAAEMFPKLLMDTLGIRDNREFYSSEDSLYILKDFPNHKYAFSEIRATTRFDLEKCKHPTRVLAQRSNNDTVFIQLKYGKGNFFLHAVPSAFTNINLLKENKYDFAFRSLSYIPSTNNILWDEFQKQGPVGERSMLRVIYTSDGLMTAFYITLVGFLLFMIFRAKRTQRIIPIITSPVNSSVEFLETISNLYYKKKDFHTIVAKRHSYFLDYIRKNYYLSTEHVDAEFMKNLSVKSGMGIDKLNDIFLHYQDIMSLAYISNTLFLEYNSLLEEFYKVAKNK